MNQKLKVALLAVITIITAFFISQNKIEIKDEVKNSVVKTKIEKRAIFISYIEYQDYLKGKNKQDITNEIIKMIDNIKKYKFNMLILHVSPFSDAIYESKIFPSSSSIVNKEGEKLPIDVLSYFIEVAHKNNIELHAWINPYRISNSTDVTKLSSTNPAYKWLNTNNVKVIENKGIYYNPASSEVHDLIISGIEEIVKNYDVDGIHLDDYFYPDTTIDLENYQPFENTISLTDYRLSNTNKLVKDIYDKIKSINNKVLFGISPEGNIENNYNNNYADVKKWISEKGYIDYIMPQLYYGFLNESKPFLKTLNEWYDLVKIDIAFIPALALYKSGTIDEYAKSGKYEWIENNDIIVREIKSLKSLKKYDGYSLFRYSNLINYSDRTNLESELTKIMNLDN